MSFKIGPSKIQGKGVLSTKMLRKGESVGEGIQFNWMGGLLPMPQITDHLGKWINHSYRPTSELRWRNGAWHVVIVHDLPSNEEITLDYSHTPWYIEGALSHYV